MELVRVDLDDHIVLDCAGCGAERRFAQPPCPDGHGADCPEWACTACGAAVLLGPAPAASASASPGARGGLRGRTAPRELSGQREHHGGRGRGAAPVPA